MHRVDCHGKVKKVLGNPGSVRNCPRDYLPNGDKRVNLRNCSKKRRSPRGTVLQAQADFQRFPDFIDFLEKNGGEKLCSLFASKIIPVFGPNGGNTYQLTHRITIVVGGKKQQAKLSIHFSFDFDFRGADYQWDSDCFISRISCCGCARGILSNLFPDKCCINAGGQI